jgi:hypothetical protein
MSDVIDEETGQAGRVGPHRESHEERLNGLTFLAEGVTPVQGFIKWSGVQPIGNAWGMAYNARLGCCGFSGCQHYNMAIAVANGEDWKDCYKTTWAPNYPNLPDAYYAYGIAQGEPGPHPDEGVDNATMLAWMYKLGMIDGYLEVPKGYEDWFAMTFHGALIGQNLDATIAINDFNANPRIPWDTMGITDGHDTLLIAGDGEGGGDEITWGGVQPFTPGYRQNNWTDCWVIIDKEDPNVNQAALAQILTEMHGVVNPVEDSPAAKAHGFIHELEQELTSLYHEVPSGLKGFIHGLHKASDAALEHEAVDVIEQLLADALKAYSHGLL